MSFTSDDIHVEIEALTLGPGIAGPCNEEDHPCPFKLQVFLRAPITRATHQSVIVLQIYLDGALTASCSGIAEFGQIALTLVIPPPADAIFGSAYMLELKVFDDFSNLSRFYALAYGSLEALKSF